MKLFIFVSMDKKVEALRRYFTGKTFRHHARLNDWVLSGELTITGVEYHHGPIRLHVNSFNVWSSNPFCDTSSKHGSLNARTFIQTFFKMVENYFGISNFTIITEEWNYLYTKGDVW